MIKLLKYEFKQTWRIGTTLLAGTLLGSLGLIFNPFSPSVIGALYITLFSLIMVASPIALVIYCIISFNQDFAGGQGYLMMTLPIKAKDFIWAKFTGQLVWNMLMGIILIVSLPIIINRYEGVNISMSMIAGGVPYFGLGIANGLSAYILTMFIIYFSIVVLSIRPRSNHITFMKMILAMVILNVMNLLVGGMSVLIVGIPLAIRQGIPTNMLDILRFTDYMQSNVLGFNVVNLIINIFLAGIFYLLTKNIIENKVQI